ncbi:hypothetical protein SACS_0814 [Parasaccharibacter apium]|uniref:Uncharacterized protein n=1 Tax=Parasaccharibacter apium TaxID=1510841 RepID=A0A7U7G5J5_9PROT|nr:hypothetical protein SACS_0814 [Parasaccharibacter apium]
MVEEPAFFCIPHFGMKNAMCLARKYFTIMKQTSFTRP